MSSNPLSKPSSKPSRKPSRKLSSKPSRRPSSKPSNKPLSKPSNKLSSKPSNKLSSKPSNKLSSKPSSNKPSSSMSCSTSSISENQENYDQKGRGEIIEQCYYYNMSHPFKGKMLIINSEEYADGTNRTGSSVDVENLKKTFQKFGFKIEVLNDLSGRKILQSLKKTSREDFDEFSCLFVVVLCHGKKGGLIAKDGKYYTIEDLQQNFYPDRCPKLRDKPKVFIISACRGEDEEKSCLVVDDAISQKGPKKARRENDASDLGTEVSSPLSSLHVPLDFCTVYACGSGNMSYRSEDKGTIMIQALCQSMEQYGHKYCFVDVLCLMSQTILEKIADEDCVQKPEFTVKFSKILKFERQIE